MDFIIGALGALIVLALFGGGVFLGWRLHGRYCRPKAAPMPDEDLKRLKAEQEAFHQLSHYNADVAYGRKTSNDPFEEG